MAPAKFQIDGADVCLHCDDIAAALPFYTDGLRMRVSQIFPADKPRVAVLSGRGLRLRLGRDHPRGGEIRVACDDPAAAVAELRQCGGVVDGTSKNCVRAPNGTVVVLASSRRSIVMPELKPSFVLSRRSAAGWGVGRAGMQYRDLVPSRLGGRYIASHIRIPDGGAVPDYVHYHHVHFQLIYCVKGWVRVVYEGQGEPFVLKAGDCVNQPPAIRHRVLEASPGLEVVEIGCPAEHETHADLRMTLPTAEANPQRKWAGQSFLRHRADGAKWRRSAFAGMSVCDTLMDHATAGVASVRVMRPGQQSGAGWVLHKSEFYFLFVTSGSATLHVQGDDAVLLAEADSVAIPAHTPFRLADQSPSLELLEVGLPAAVPVPAPAPKM